MKKNYNYDQIEAGYYDKIYKNRKNIQSKWHHLKFQEVKNLLSEGRILDLGCSGGTFSGLLPENIKYTGVDLSLKQIEYAAKNYERNNFICGNSYKLPFKNCVFDTVVLIECLEHLPTENISLVLSEIKRVLKKNGKLILTTPNYFSFWQLIEILIGFLSPVSYEEQHITKFTKKKLFKCLQNNGFIDINIKSYMGISPFLSFINWSIPDKINVLEKKLSFLNFGFLLISESHCEKD